MDALVDSSGQSLYNHQLCIMSTEHMQIPHLNIGSSPILNVTSWYNLYKSYTAVYTKQYY